MEFLSLFNVNVKTTTKTENQMIIIDKFLL